MKDVPSHRPRAILLLLGLLALWPAARAVAQCLGDCENRGSVGSGELTKIIAIINYCPCGAPLIGGAADGCAAIPGNDRRCVNADRNRDNCITAGELTGVIADMINFPSGCPPQPTSPPTDTPAAPTATNAPATVATAVSTSTVTAVPTGTATQAPAATATPSGTATASPTSTPSAAPAAVCGNGVIEPGETCVTCAADCAVRLCSATTPVRTVKVNLAVPADQVVSGLTLLIGYKSGTVSLPGSGAASSVGSRIKNKPSNTIFAFNDLDYALRAVLSRSSGFSAGQLYTVDFDSCQGAAAPTPADFSCTVEGCSNTFGPVDGCTCSASL